MIDGAGAVAGLYGGPLEDFVRERDALAKALRAEGRREEASAVKTLRKPSRAAWALDAAALDGEGSIDALVAAVAATLDAQAAGGDVRGAIGALRAAVRDFAAHAARAAERAGHRLDHGTLSSAVLAVLGKPDAFAALRRGALADVPDAGGLDFLSSLPAPTEPLARPSTPKRAPEPPTPSAEAEASPAPEPERNAAEAAARRELEDAYAALAAARANADQATRALRAVEKEAVAAEEQLRSAEEQLRTAEEKVRNAEAEASTVRSRRARATEEAERTAALLAEAERAAARAAGQLDRRS